MPVQNLHQNLNTEAKRNHRIKSPDNIPARSDYNPVPVQHRLIQTKPNCSSIQNNKAHIHDHDKQDPWYWRPQRAQGRKEDICTNDSDGDGGEKEIATMAKLQWRQRSVRLNVYTPNVYNKPSQIFQTSMQDKL